MFLWLEGWLRFRRRMSSSEFRVFGGFMTTSLSNDAEASGAQETVAIFSITQATRATFPNIYFGQAVLIFIQEGMKRVLCPHRGEVVGAAGDVMVFPPGAMVTLENRPMMNGSYRADAVCFPQAMVDAVFGEQRASSTGAGVQLVKVGEERPLAVCDLVRQTLARDDLPAPILQQRLMEPLIWLRHCGVQLPSGAPDLPFGRVRRLIESDLARPWRAADVAAGLAMSEATLRRWLARSGHSFSHILQNSRLERGLTLLQTTDLSILQIALECGFKTPSHFSDSFRKRFGIQPKAIRTALVSAA